MSSNLNLTYAHLKESSPEIERIYHNFSLAEKKMVTALTRGEENEYGRLANSYDIGTQAVKDAKAIAQELQEKVQTDKQTLWSKFDGDFENTSVGDAQAIVKSLNKAQYEDAIETISESSVVRKALAKYVSIFGQGGVRTALEFRNQTFKLMNDQALTKLNEVEEAIPRLLQSYQVGVEAVVAENSSENWHTAQEIAESRYQGEDND